MSAALGAIRLGRRKGFGMPLGAVAATVAAAAALLVAPSVAGAATTCELTGAVLDVTMGASNDLADLDPEGGTIFVSDQIGPVTCGGATPTVNNTDAISVHNASGQTNNDVGIFDANQLAPGKTAEAGADEIEIFVNLNGGDFSELEVSPDTTGGSIVFGTSGINPNATGAEDAPDADIILTDVPFLRGTGNSGADFISAQGAQGAGAPLPTNIVLSGLSGDDALFGGEGNDVIEGGAERDDLRGNAGGDIIDAGSGENFAVLGGAGDDFLVPGSAGDPVLGGDGTDRLAYNFHLTAGVTFDVQGSEIENVQGTLFADVLRGDAGPNELDGLDGNDVLEGRGGVDELSGDSGDDSLDVRDGGPDSADCNVGTDTVTADPPGIDTLFDCENVLFPAAPAPPAPPQPISQSPPTPEAEPSNEFSLGKAKKNKEKGTAKLAVIVPGPGEIDLAGTRKVKPQEERAEDGGEVKLAIKPSRRSKQRLREKGKARVSAGVTYTPDGGEANTQSRTVKLIKK